ncbi:Ig-like domain-containing protein [Treponema parvum]|uniref:Ig-like domain-containing protein n=1 Tax=Treponema parvum TaxID=138851 RepID=A0A975F5T3_9SPIR|nr:Ig-like domain-containing protein [Treponema parvum]QTQ14992.1 Ig-like domain-containing protein [Treponema parvum]
MSLRTKTLILFLLFSAFLSSCKLITFDEEGVSCSLSSTENTFSGQTIEFVFTSKPDKYQAEKCVSLQVDSRAVELIYSWNGKTLSIKPALSWQNGKNYHLSCSGTITINTSRVSVSIERTFMYGSISEQLIFLKSSSTLSPINQTDSLLFCFNKALDQASFTENFTLSPSLETETVFSSDNKSVSIKPKAPWAYNTLYTWSFKNLKSADGYFYKTSESASFSPFSDTEIPVLQKICPVRLIGGQETFLLEQELDLNIREKEAIGFVFSKPMEFDSVKSGISLSPPAAGYFKQTDDEGFCFAFIPTQMYSIKQKYELTVNSSVRDTHSVSLYEDKILYFTPYGDYLEVRQISLDSAQIDFSTQDAVPFTITKNLNNKYELTVSILFSARIESSKRSSAVKQVSLGLLFPLSSETPVQTQILWNSAGTLLSLTWENFTPCTASVETFYKLQITGGANGINTGCGQFMEKDLCVILKPQT